MLVAVAISLAAMAVYASYTVIQIRNLRHLETEIIGRTRMDSLLLLRIQNDLNSAALSMRDMLDSSEPYPLSAWRGTFKRIRVDLEDALSREEQYAPMHRTGSQRQYVASSFAQFWDGLNRTFALADSGNESEARTQVRISLQARQAALSTTISRFLIQNNESEEQAVAATAAIYAGAERNVYLFLIAMLAVIAISSLALFRFSRSVFQQIEDLSRRRGELAQQLISTQENTYRSISRELHDEFGQILTAIGAMLHRLERRSAPGDAALSAGLHEVREIAHEALEKVRTLSQALHPIMLDEAGFESALEWYLQRFEERTGVTVHYEKRGMGFPLEQAVSIHLYRIAQEALNNIARHSQSTTADVRLIFSANEIAIEIEDQGIGFPGPRPGHGMGLVAMRERAELIHGRIEFINKETKGAMVRVTAPSKVAEIVEAHAG